MVSDREELTVYRGFSSAETAVREGEAVIRAVRVYELMLGASALAGSAKAVLEPVAAELLSTAEALQARVENIEEKELFGGDNSYWNMFRYFCLDGNRGMLKSSEQIWNHLALTFDMEEESLSSVSDTLMSWKNDFEEDALQKYKADGVFDEVAGGFVFYESPESIERRRVTQKRSERKTINQESVQVDERTITDYQTQSDEIFVEQVGLEERIVSAVTMQQGSGKQADIIKGILDNDESLTHQEVLDVINDLVQRGTIYKFKPGLGRPARLTAEEDEIYEESMPTREEQKEETAAVVDIEVAQEILKLITPRGRKPEQMMSTSKIVTYFNNMGKNVKPSTINNIIRRLADAELVMTDEGALVTGKKPKSRGRSHKGFRVGVADPESMQLIRDLLHTNSLEEYFHDQE